MFDLKRPCKNCPFRKDQGHLFRLPPRRLAEIRRASAFQCHKTLDRDAEEGEDRSGSRPQQCAGLMAVLRREGQDNQIMQIAQRFGVSLDGVDPDGEAYDSWADVEAAHGGESAMMTVDDCLKAAWAALLRGDTAERDRMCDLARNLINAEQRVRSSGRVEDIIEGRPICLPDLSEEKLL